MKLKGMFLVRFAISFIFIVFGVWEILDPIYWAPFVPSLVKVVFNPLFVTTLHGLILLILGLLTLIGFRKKIVAPLTSLVLASVCISVFLFSGFSDLLIRDITILICSLALIFEVEKEKSS